MVFISGPRSQAAGGSWASELDCAPCKPTRTAKLLLGFGGRWRLAGLELSRYGHCSEDTPSWRLLELTHAFVVCRCCSACQDVKSCLVSPHESLSLINSVAQLTSLQVVYV